MAGRSRIRRVTTWVLVGLYGLVASGLPLPWDLPVGAERAPGTAATPPLAKAAAVLAAKDRSRPFPCMNRPCGCGTAEQCFSSCCCHTPAERLAWARAHRVEPGVIAALERRVALATGAVTAADGCCTRSAETADGCARSAATADCCARSAATADCCARSAATADGCARSAATADGCGSTDDDHGASPADTAAAESPAADPPVGEDMPRRTKTISLRAMLACGGLAAEWFASGGGGLPPPRVGLVLGPGLVTAVGGDDQRPSCPAAPPDVPPPKC